MKTPLPEKLPLAEVILTSPFTLKAINQLIDVVTELTAVVEGKQVQEEYVADPRRYAGDTNECICMDGGGPDGCNGVHKRTVPTPTLKEQLLGEIDSLQKDEVKWKKSKHDVKSVDAVLYNRALLDVKVIINRLIK